MVDIAAVVREAHGVRKVRADELPRIAGVLGSAFLEDPAVSWLVPDERRRGAVMERAYLLFLRCDRDGLPAYLEATTPRNRAFYEPHGFAVTEEFRLGQASPPLWRMWRKPGG